MWGILESLIAWLLECTLARWMKPKPPVEIAHEVEDENRRAMRDGDAVKRLRDEWSRVE